MSKIEAGNYTKLVTWKEDPTGLFDPDEFGKRKEEREADPSLPPLNNGFGFRSTRMDGTVFDFTYDTEEEALEGMKEFYSPENMLKMLSEMLEGHEVA